MGGPPVPQRIPPLVWRKPAFVWTPLALAAAVGWPAGLFYREPNLQRMALVAGAAVFAIALVTLGLSWAMGRAPKVRRDVVMHVMFAGVLMALAAPFVLTELLSAVAKAENATPTLTLEMAMTMIPLALVLGLPIALASGIVFAWLALKRPPLEDGALMDFRSDVQPFR